MPSVLITGAGRGLGLEFVRQYAADGWKVFATVRDRSRAPELERLGPSVVVHALDVNDHEAIKSLAHDLRLQPIDVVIANAGVSGPRGMTIEAVDGASWLETLAVNTVAPVVLAGAFMKHLEKGTQKKLIAISSRLGSIAANQTGTLYVYRSSKAALNAAWKSIALDYAGAGITAAVFHPGWVRTDMGGPGADIDVATSVGGMRHAIETLSPATSGHFFNYDGTELPW
ncbi:MAG TPA: SDR family oxidoreductase [Stellaceae bacterium]|nr:SDR family oxidoreductase [Stellaceae bacterium]